MSSWQKNTCALTVFMLLFAFTGVSQVEDFQIWNEFSLQKKIHKKVTLILQQDIRFQNNATQFKNSVSVFGAEYTLTKAFKVKGLYRYTYAIDLEDGPENEHRFYVDANLKHKINRFILGYRARYQLKFEHFNANRWHYMRNRFTVKYNIRKSPLLPYAEYEFYYSLNNPYQNSVDRTRYTMGLEYGISKDISIYSYYRILLRREYDKVPSNRYILGLGISIDI